MAMVVIMTPTIATRPMPIPHNARNSLLKRVVTSSCMIDSPITGRNVLACRALVNRFVSVWPILARLQGIIGENQFGRCNGGGPFRVPIGLIASVIAGRARAKMREDAAGFESIIRPPDAEGVKQVKPGHRP